jgi:hypothetical protein
MNYNDNGNNDYMRHIANMLSSGKFYKDDFESFIYDIIQLVREMVPSLVEEALRNRQFDISFDAAAFRKSIEDALSF